MAKRTTEIRVHIEPSLADTLRRLAAKEDKTISTYGRNVFINHLQSLGVITVDDALRALK